MKEPELTHEAARQLVVRRLTGELDAKLLDVLQLHLAGCDECRQYSREMEMTYQLVAAISIPSMEAPDVEESMPSAADRERLLTAIRAGVGPSALKNVREWLVRTFGVGKDLILGFRMLQDAAKVELRELQGGLLTTLHGSQARLQPAPSLVLRGADKETDEHEQYERAAARALDELGLSSLEEVTGLPESQRQRFLEVLSKQLIEEKKSVPPPDAEAIDGSGSVVARATLRGNRLLIQVGEGIRTQAKVALVSPSGSVIRSWTPDVSGIVELSLEAVGPDALIAVIA